MYGGFVRGCVWGAWLTLFDMHKELNFAFRWSTGFKREFFFPVIGTDAHQSQIWKFWGGVENSVKRTLHNFKHLVTL